LRRPDELTLGSTTWTRTWPESCSEPIMPSSGGFHQAVDKRPGRR
jgi:hypothetical protein